MKTIHIKCTIFSLCCKISIIAAPFCDLVRVVRKNFKEIRTYKYLQAGNYRKNIVVYGNMLTASVLSYNSSTSISCDIILFCLTCAILVMCNWYNSAYV